MERDTLLSLKIKFKVSGTKFLQYKAAHERLGEGKMKRRKGVLPGNSIEVS